MKRSVALRGDNGSADSFEAETAPVGDIIRGAFLRFPKN